MQIQLHSPAKRVAVLLVTFTVSALVCTLAVTDFLAVHFAEQAKLRSLTLAARLSPWNAEYPGRIGRLYVLTQDIEAALTSFRAATVLNPNRAAYWLDLVAAYPAQSNLQVEHAMLERAVAAEPMNPEAAWLAGNHYMVYGKQDRALQEFRVVIGNDPEKQALAIRQAWIVKPDVPLLLANAFPPTVVSHIAFLSFLETRNETDGTLQVWARIVGLNQPLQQSFVFGYVSYLLHHKRVEEAGQVWSQAAHLADLENYQPTKQNLIVNGDFSLNVLNGGFDWTYSKLPDVALALDPVQSFSGHHSLLITLDKARLSDVGIQQWVRVLPNTRYKFSGHFRSEAVEGAGGLRFTLHDAFDGTQCFGSEELKAADFWRETAGEFTTSPRSKLLLLQIRRDPSGSPMQGKFWIDGLRLMEKQQD